MRGPGDRDEAGMVAELAAGAPSIAAAASFDQLVDRYLDPAYRLASVVLGDPVEAEDAAHDAAVLAWRGFAGLRDVDRFEPWFFRIVMNVCRDRLRRRRRQPMVALPADDDDAMIAADTSGNLLQRDALDHAFGILEPDQRILVALRFYEDLQVDAIAQRLGIPAGTVKSRLHSAMRRLRRDLERQGWREEDGDA